MLKHIPCNHFWRPLERKLRQGKGKGLENFTRAKHSQSVRNILWLGLNQALILNKKEQWNGLPQTKSLLKWKLKLNNILGIYTNSHQTQDCIVSTTHIKYLLFWSSSFSALSNIAKVLIFCRNNIYLPLDFRSGLMVQWRDILTYRMVLSTFLLGSDWMLHSKYCSDIHLFLSWVRVHVAFLLVAHIF